MRLSQPLGSLHVGCQAGFPHHLFRTSRGILQDRSSLGFRFRKALTPFFCPRQTFLNQPSPLGQHVEHWPIGKTPKHRQHDEKVDRLSGEFCPIEAQLLSELVTGFDK